MKAVGGKFWLVHIGPFYACMRVLHTKFYLKTFNLHLVASSPSFDQCNVNTKCIQQYDQDCCTLISSVEFHINLYVGLLYYVVITSICEHRLFLASTTRSVDEQGPSNTNFSCIVLWMHFSSCAALKYIFTLHLPNFHGPRKKTWK